MSNVQVASAGGDRKLFEYGYAWDPFASIDENMNKRFGDAWTPLNPRAHDDSGSHHHH